MIQLGSELVHVLLSNLATRGKKISLSLAISGRWSQCFLHIICFRKRTITDLSLLSPPFYSTLTRKHYWHFVPERNSKPTRLKRYWWNTDDVMIEKILFRGTCLKSFLVAVVSKVWYWYYILPWMQRYHSRFTPSDPWLESRLWWYFFPTA